MITCSSHPHRSFTKLQWNMIEECFLCCLYVDVVFVYWLVLIVEVDVFALATGY